MEALVLGSNAVIRWKETFVFIIIVLCFVSVLVLACWRPYFLYDYVWLGGGYSQDEEVFYAKALLERGPSGSICVEKIRNYGPRKNAMLILFMGSESVSSSQWEYEILEITKAIKRSNVRNLVVVIATTEFHDRHLELLVGLEGMTELYFVPENFVTTGQLEKFRAARPDVNFVLRKPDSQPYPWDPDNEF